MANVIVTGANRGIGLRLARLLVERGDEVTGTCRMASDGLIELGVRIEQLDLTDPVSIEAFARRIDEPVDLLINNAGVLDHDDVDSLDFDGIRRQFEVNALGPLRVTSALMPRLAEGSKVAFVSSHMGSVHDAFEDGRMYGYRMSKAALNMAARCLAHDLRLRGVTVGIFHPGFVRTDMTNNLGHLSPLASAKRLLAHIDDLGPDQTGRFVGTEGEDIAF